MCTLWFHFHRTIIETKKYSGVHPRVSTLIQPSFQIKKYCSSSICARDESYSILLVTVIGKIFYRNNVGPFQDFFLEVRPFFTVLIPITVHLLGVISPLFFSSFFFLFSRVFARIWGFRNYQKDPPKNFFSPRKSGRRALRARLPAGHRVERRRVHQV